MMRFVFPLAAAAAFAQPVSFGLKGGAPISNPSDRFVPLFGTISQGHWIGGPTVELHLPKRFSLELDALHRTNRSQSSMPTAFGPGVNSYLIATGQKTKAWDFPLLLKYRILDGPVKPFVSGGIAWSRESVKAQWLYQCLGPDRSCLPPDAGPDFNPRGGYVEYARWLRGAALGAGVEFQTRYFTVSPEVRANAYGRLNQNNVGVTAIVGFTFRRKK